MMETVVCDTLDQCTPVDGLDHPDGTQPQPKSAERDCEPGSSCSWLGGSPFLMRNTGSNDYSSNNSFQWTDSDYDDITLVISCPEKKITQYTSKVWLSK